MSYKPPLHQRYPHPLTGEYLPGVTTITGRDPDGKAAMLNKAVALTKEGIDHKKLWSWKANIGSLCHDMIRWYIMELGMPDLAEWPENIIRPAKVGLRAFKKWERQAKPVYLASEMVVINAEHGYGGTLDIWADVYGARRVIDIKTGGWYKTAEMQTAAYDEAITDELIRSIRHQIDLIPAYQWGTPIGLQLDCEDGTFSVHHSMDTRHRQRWRQFLNLLEGWKLDKK